MEIKSYKSEYEYSYTLGAFPTIELIQKKKEQVVKILFHSSFQNEEVIRDITNLIGENKIIVADKLIEKLSKKENVYVLGIFLKYKSSLSKEEDHLVLDNPSNMGNLGTIMRSSLGFGIKDIAIIRPGVDMFDPKVIRSSMGSIFSLNVEYFDSIEDYQKVFPKHKLLKFMLQAKKSVRDEPFNEHPLSLVFGNEATGINHKYLDEDSLIIRHSKAIDSLNITNAVSIALFEYSEKNHQY